MNTFQNLRMLPKNIWLISLVALINRSGTMVLPFLALYLTQEIGVEPGKAGMALAFYGLGALVSAPFAGKLSDKIGELNLIKLSLFSSGIVFFIFTLFSDYYTIIILSVILAIVGEAFRPAGMAFISNEAPIDKRKQAYALYRLAINLGMSIGPVLGGILSAIKFNLIFYIDGLTAITAGIVLLLFRWDIKGKKFTNGENDKSIDEIQKPVIKDLQFIYFLLASIPVTIVFFQHFTTMPLFIVEDLGFTRTAFGLFTAVNTVIIIFIEVPLNNKTSSWSDWKSLAFGAFLCALGFGGMTFVTGSIGLIATIVIWTFGEMIFFPASASLAAAISPENKRGEYMGYYNMMFSLVFIIAPYGGTLIYEIYGPNILWIIAFFTAGLTTLLMLHLRKMDSK